MTHYRLATAALVVVIPLAACENEPLTGYTQPGIIIGQMCELSTGAPLANVAVGFDAMGYGEITTKTDEDGNFRFEDVPAGEGHLIVDAGGVSRSFDTTVLEGEPTSFRDPSCRDTPLEPDVGTVEGIVCNRHVGALVNDALVVLSLGDGTQLQTATDEAGFFRLPDVPAGSHLLQVSATGYSRSYLVEVQAGETYEIDAGQSCEQVDGSSGLVTGSLCDPAAPAGTPLAGADVTMTDGNGEHFGARTDADGVFVAGPATTGPADVRVVRAPDIDITVATNVVAGAESEVVFPALTCGSSPPEEPVPPAEPSDPPNEESDPPGEETEPPGEESEPLSGDVEGRVCAPDSATYLAGATVYIDAEGERYETTTDGDGSWRLSGIPVGTWLAHVSKGSFEATVSVTVSSGQVYVVPEAECAVAQDHLMIAVVDGDWDNVYDVLLNVGIDAGIVDRYNGRQSDNGWVGNLLGDYAVLSSYDIVLINCGAAEDGFFTNTIYAENLKQFVADGGSVYASDWAYDFVEKTFPGSIDFYRDDLTRNDAERAKAKANIVATISDVTLGAAMGQNDFVLHHQWDEWAVISQVASNVRVYVRGPASADVDGVIEELPDVPYTVGFTFGAGKVIYTSFHQEEANMNPDAERLLQLLVFEL